MQAYLFNGVSLAIALAAVAVATWQVRAAAKSTERSNAIPVLSELSREVRSAEFRHSLVTLLTTTPEAPPAGGFDELPLDWREHAYRVCYFFDYLGVLVSKGIISANTIVSWIGTWIMRVWIVMQPCILAERRHRENAYPQHTPCGFLPNFENLVGIILQNGGSAAAERIQLEAGLLRLGEATLRELRESGDSAQRRAQAGSTGTEPVAAE
jgi:hypothetical protein